MLHDHAWLLCTIFLYAGFSVPCCLLGKGLLVVVLSATLCTQLVLLGTLCFRVYHYWLARAVFASLQRVAF